MGPALLLLAALATATTDSTPRPLTLAQAEALAEINSPTMIAARGQQRTATAGVRQAYAAFLPSVDVSAGVSRSVVALGSAPSAYSAGLGLGVDLFSGGSRLFEVQRARASRRGADVGLVRARYATALAVAQDFFDALAAHESESAARAQLEQAEQTLRVSIARLASHTVTRSDSLRAEIQVRAAQLALLQARTDLQVADASLARAVGSDAPVTASPADTSVDADLSVDDATLARLAENGPAVSASRAALEAARATRRSSWSAYLPSLSASVSRTGDAEGTSLVPSGAAFGGASALRLSMSLPIFDRLKRESQVTAADVAEVDAEATLSDALRGAHSDLVQSLGAFRTARERVASQQATLAAAEEDLRVQEQRYSIGGSTHLDVLTSQTTLEQARRDLIRARYDLRVARAQLETLVGRPL